MKHLFVRILLVSGFLATVACSDGETVTETMPEEPKGVENVAHKWSLTAIEATALDTERFKPRPTISSRFLGLIFTSAFDAWTRYDSAAIPVYLQGVERRPSDEQTLANKEKAISYAFYRAMMHYYWTDSTLFKNRMVELGYDPMDNSMDPTTPAGIGNLAAKMVIDARRNDGSNQYAEVEGSEGRTYWDYTQYEPVNPVDQNNDLNKWQPKYFSDGMGGKFAPGCLTPHWPHVKTITMDSSSQFRPGPPPLVGSEQLAIEVKEVVDLQANITPEEKALVEFMRDGPQSVQQAGHWLKFAQDVSRRDNHTLDEDIKMYFLNQIVAMDAFIASWDSKMHYDFARPFALVHEYYRDSTIYGWAGPEEGWKEMKGSEWRPYSPDTFLCPPFPSYTSGHSTISGACAQALKLYTGSDEFGETVRLVPGYLTEPNNLGDTVTLEFPTFRKTAEMAGISRVLGGYHIQADNVAGLQLGVDVANNAFEFYKRHLGQ